FHLYRDKALHVWHTNKVAIQIQQTINIWYPMRHRDNHCKHVKIYTSTHMSGFKLAA
ncbi:hypothetical protein Leryth_015090, partial [Lithospermum erythrorhizon]